LFLHEQSRFGTNQGVVYVGSLDGRVYALDAATGAGP
jgi:outer membrane protein assembly factor BamB